MDEPIIAGIWGREILDSRGNPTVEAEVTLESGAAGWAAVPSGASTGAREAIELRDGDEERYLGKGVLNAVNNINEIISKELIGLDATDQLGIDKWLIEMDGTTNKENLGANAILAVSMACARAASNHIGQPLYNYLGGTNCKVLPLPMMNLINGGAHASNNLDIQEFMIIPTSMRTFRDALRAASEVFHILAKTLQEDGLSTGVGDEGGFAPSLPNNSQAIEYLLKAIEKAGFIPGRDIWLAMDCAASSFYDAENDIYDLKGEGKKLDVDGLIEYYGKMIEKYPIASIEDPLAEDDWDGWIKMTEAFNDKIQIVGDDIFVTNPRYISRGIIKKCANASLIKLNQIGTVSETIDAINISLRSGWNAVISHRSGETEDTFIADLAVATGVGQIKTGSCSRGERMCKYNQLMRIEEELIGVSFFQEASNIFPGINR